MEGRTTAGRDGEHEGPAQENNGGQETTQEQFVNIHNHLCHF